MTKQEHEECTALIERISVAAGIRCDCPFCELSRTCEHEWSDSIDGVALPGDGEHCPKCFASRYMSLPGLCRVLKQVAAERN